MSGYQPLQPWSWLLAPMLVSLFATIILATPVRFVGLALPEPVFPMTLAFAWAVIRPSILGPFLLMVGGLFLDLFWHGELGLWAFCLVTVYGLSLLVRNLMDNALRYSPVGARIQVSVQKEPGVTVLQVQDSGPGMTEEAITHLGERFFRVLGNDQPGSGLGWSIVRRLLKVFGAQAQMGPSEALGGLSVTVRWPGPLGP